MYKLKNNYNFFLLPCVLKYFSFFVWLFAVFLSFNLEANLKVATKLINTKNSLTVNNLPKNELSKFKHLSVLENGQTVLPSNANNFHGQWNASVNPRTGKSSFAVTIGSLLFDQGNSRRDISISYTSNSFSSNSNLFGLGAEWSWNIGMERRSITNIVGSLTTDITLSDGHSFTMASKINEHGKRQWRILRHKLKDVVITGYPSNWTISTTTGLREHINNGYEDWEETQSGKRMWFYYDRKNILGSTRHLKYICAHSLTASELKKASNVCAGDGIWFTYDQNHINVHGMQNIIINKSKIAGHIQITQISMPSLSSIGVSNHNNNSKLRLTYDTRGGFPWLLHSVILPTGTVSTFLYNTEADKNNTKTNGLLVDNYNHKIPVVTELINHDKFSNGYDFKTWYKYGDKNNNKHNYTGFQNGLSIIQGKDNLADRADTYTYNTTEDNGIFNKTTTYNKYHLPLQEIVKSNSTGRVIAKSATDYPVWKNTTFIQLQDTYSLPTKISKTFFTYKHEGLNNSRVVSQNTRYNKYGQLIWKRNTSGDQMFIQYCLEKATKHCLGHIQGWPNLALPEKVLIIPSVLSEISIEDQPHAIETVFDYTRIKIKPIFEKQALQSSESTSTFIKNYGVDHIKKKTMGTVPHSKIKNLIPGSYIPDIENSNVSTKTIYKYDTKPQSTNYGELKSLTLKKYPSAQPNIYNKLLPLSFSVNKYTKNKVASLTFNIVRKVNIVKGERTISMFMDKNKSTSNSLKQLSENNFLDDINLGQKTYSIHNGNKLSENNPLNDLQIVWKYDLWMRPIEKILIPANGLNKKITTWKYISTDKENSIVVIKPGGSEQKFVLNGEMKVISKWFRFCLDKKKSIEGFDNWIQLSTISYGPGGEQTAVKTYVQGNKGRRNALITRYGYDEFKRPLWIEKSDGQVDVIIHDDTNLRSYVYHIVSGIDHRQTHLGNLLKIVDSNLHGQPLATYVIPLTSNIKKNGHYLYPKNTQQKLFNLIKTLQPVDTLKHINTCGLISKNKLIDFVQNVIKQQLWYTKDQFFYDSAGNKIKHIANNGAVTRWMWKNGNLITEITPDNRIIHDEYDIRGDKISRCVIPNNSSKDAKCHSLGYREFNEAGDLIKQTDETNKSIIFSYDNNGRVIKKILPSSKKEEKGHIVTYKYNSIGIVEKDIDGKPDVFYNYDKITWNLTDVEDHVSHQHYDYDSQTNLPIKIIRSIPQKLKSYSGINYPGGVINFKWDQYGYLLYMTDEEGNKFSNIYDNIGRIIKKIVYIHNSTIPTVLVAIKYNLYSRPKIIISGANISKFFTYDNLGRLASNTESKNGNILYKIVYTYEENTENIASIKRSEPSSESPNKLTTTTQKYTYDITGNLTKMQCYTTSNMAQNFCPREISYLQSGLKIAPIIVEQNYSFDSWNNISKIQEKLTTINNEKLTKTVQYEYSKQPTDANQKSENYNPHRMISFYENWSTKQYSLKPHVIQYDELGRVVVDTNGNKLHYNAIGQQDKFTDFITGNIVNYTYDSEGHQIAEKEIYGKGKLKGKAIQDILYMFYMGGHINRQIQTNAQGKKHVSENFISMAHAEDGKITNWYLHDYKGDIISVIDNSGKIIVDNVYSPYGMKYNIKERRNQKIIKSLKTTNQNPWWKIHELGFNGEMLDPATGYQFLGGGYRAYNPIYKHFMSKDSYSPFAEIDGYGYAKNNPVMNTDPTGHLPEWTGYLFGLTTLALSALVSTTFPVTAFMSSLYFSSIDSLLEGLTATLALAGTTSVSGIAAGSLQIASTAKPTNATLKKVNDFAGIINSLLFMTVDTYSAVISISNIIASSSKLSNSLFLATTIFGNGAIATSGAASALNIAADYKPTLAYQKSFKEMVLGLNIASGILAVSSIAASIAAIGTSINPTKDLWIKIKRRNSVYKQEIEEANNSSFSGRRKFLFDKYVADHAPNESPAYYSSFSNTIYISRTKFDGSRIFDGTTLTENLSKFKNIKENSQRYLSSVNAKQAIWQLHIEFVTQEQLENIITYIHSNYMDTNYSFIAIANDR